MGANLVILAQPDADVGADFSRQVLHSFGEELQGIASSLRWKGHSPGQHLRSNRMQSILEGRRNAKVPAAAAYGPKEIRIISSAHAPPLTVCRDEVRCNEVVAGNTEAPGEPAEAASQREPCDTSVGDLTEYCCESLLLSSRVDIAPPCAAFNESAPALGIDTHTAHGAEADDHAFVAGRLA